MPTVSRSLMSARRRSRAVRLIETLLRSGMSEAVLAMHLDIGPEFLADVRTGRRRLRWVKQVLLAAVAEKHDSAIAGAVASLRAELAAVAEYRARVAASPTLAERNPIVRTIGRHRGGAE